MKENVKLNHLSTPFYVDFWSLCQGVQETPAHWFKCIQKNSKQQNNSKQHLLLDWDNTDQDRGKSSEQIL